MTFSWWIKGSSLSLFSLCVLFLNHCLCVYFHVFLLTHTHTYTVSNRCGGSRSWRGREEKKNEKQKQSSVPFFSPLLSSSRSLLFISGLRCSVPFNTGARLVRRSCRGIVYELLGKSIKIQYLKDWRLNSC